MYSLVVVESAVRFHKLVKQSGSRVLRECWLGMQGHRYRGLLEGDRRRLEGTVGLGEGVARHVARKSVSCEEASVCERGFREEGVCEEGVCEEGFRCEGVRGEEGEENWCGDGTWLVT